MFFKSYASSIFKCFCDPLITLFWLFRFQILIGQSTVEIASQKLTVQIASQKLLVNRGCQV